MIKLLIGGDVCPINRNMPNFIAGNARAIFNDLLDEFLEADLSIVNIECPLVDRDYPIEKVGPNLRAPKGCIAGLQKAKIDVVNLANNHIMDHGANGIISTLDSCKDAGIAVVGAGSHIQEAQKILVKNVKGLKIGILGVAEREFSIATRNSYGANPLDLIDYVRNLRSNEGNFDYLTVLVHGGNEHYPFPSPRLKKVCHFLVEMGANAVIVQHTHRSGCYEEYNNSFIVYGQGNLIFDSPGYDRSFYEGFLVKLLITEDLKTSIILIPFSQSRFQAGARRLEKKRSDELLEEIKKRSMAIADDVFVRNQWLKFCESKKGSYLKRIFGHNYLLKKLVSKSIFLKIFCTEESLLRFQNTISCEARREVLETLFDNRMI